MQCSYRWSFPEVDVGLATCQYVHHYLSCTASGKASTADSGDTALRSTMRLSASGNYRSYRPPAARHKILLWTAGPLPNWLYRIHTAFILSEYRVDLVVCTADHLASDLEV